MRISKKADALEYIKIGSFAKKSPIGADQEFSTSFDQKGGAAWQHLLKA